MEESEDSDDVSEELRDRFAARVSIPLTFGNLPFGVLFLETESGLGFGFCGWLGVASLLMRFSPAAPSRMLFEGDLEVDFDDMLVSTPDGGPVAVECPLTF